MLDPGNSSIMNEKIKGAFYFDNLQAERKRFQNVPDHHEYDINFINPLFLSRVKEEI